VKGRRNTTSKKEKVRRERRKVTAKEGTAREKKEIRNEERNKGSAEE
jgi:hypothetical protein